MSIRRNILKDVVGNKTINFSKKKAISGFFCASLLIIMAMRAYYISDIQDLHNLTFVRVCSLFLIIISPFYIIFFSKCFFRKDAAFIFDKNGLINNSSVGKSILINWHDITLLKSLNLSTKNGIRKMKLNPKIILIYVKNPEIYIKKAKGLSKIIMLLNNLSYGTPLYLNPLMSNISYDEMFGLIQKYRSHLAEIKN